MWSQIDKNCKRNEQIYRQVFGCYPDSIMETFEDIEMAENIADNQLYFELSDEIIGLAVYFPLQFLNKEDLKKLRFFDLGISILPKNAFT